MSFCIEISNPLSRRNALVASVCFHKTSKLMCVLFKKKNLHFCYKSNDQMIKLITSVCSSHSNLQTEKMHEINNVPGQSRSHQLGACQTKSGNIIKVSKKQTNHRIGLAQSGGI